MTTYSWKNSADGSFDNEGNWTPNGIPLAGDTAEFTVPGPFTVSNDGTAGFIDVSDDVTFTGSIEADGLSTQFTAFEVDGGDAIFNAGTLVALSESMIGDDQSGTLSFIDGATGTLFANNGTSTPATALDIAYSQGVPGVVTVDGEGSSLTLVDAAYIGVFGNGTLAISHDGAVDLSTQVTPAEYDTFEIGVASGATGTITVDSGASLSVAEFTVIGVSGQGLVAFSGGATGTFTGQSYDHTTETYDPAAAIYVGGAAGGSGTLLADGTGTELTGNEGIYVGDYGDGLVELTNGAVINLDPVTIGTLLSNTEIGSEPGSSGTVDVSGGAQLLSADGIVVGDGGDGSINITNGATVVSNALSDGAAAAFGNDAAAVGIGTIDDSYWNSKQSFVVAEDGTGNVTIQDGSTLDVDADGLRVGRDLGSNGFLVVNDSTISAAAATLTVGPEADSSENASTTGGTGTLEVSNGSFVYVNNALVGGLTSGVGSIDLSGGSYMTFFGNLTTGAGTSVITAESGGIFYVAGSLEIGGGGGPAFMGLSDHSNVITYGAGVTIADQGTLSIDDTDGVDFSSNTIANTITLASGTLTTSSTGLADTGSAGVFVTGGSLSDPSAIVGVVGSDILLNGGVTLDNLNSTVLRLGQGFDANTVIGNFGSVDTLDLHITSQVYNTAVYDPATDTLSLTSIQDAPLTLDIANEGYSASSFSAFSDGNGGTEVVLGQPPCYVAGTRILTEKGEKRVEKLAIGDRLITRAGEARALRWIGQRRYTAAQIAANPDLAPILIRAGALADGVPSRDLYVSPMHAMFLEHLLIPAVALVNEASILRKTDIKPVTYYHLELYSHDIILAEGAEAESYIDDNNRDMFQNAGSYGSLYPKAQPEPARYCARRVEHGDEVMAIQAKLEARAVALGYTVPQTVEMSLHAVGVTRFTLPAGATKLRLLSSIGAVPGDRRVLGALMTAIRLQGQALDLASLPVVRGFHEVERHGTKTARWTNGDGMFLVPPAPIERLIEVEVGRVMGIRRVS